MPVASAEPPGDAPYYVRNFETLLGTLRQRDADLLDHEELRFIAEFFALPVAARALLVRMVMRRGILFRASRLAYAEIPDLREAVGALIAHGWVEENPPLSLEEVFRLFRHDEIAGFTAFGRPKPGESKAGRLESLRAAFAGPVPLTDLGASPDTVYRLTVDPLCERLRGMFFGNFRQEWSEMVLADLGIFRYESVTLADEARPFPSRAHVAAFLGLERCRTLLQEGTAPQEIEREMPAPLDGCEWLAARRDKLQYRLGRESERRGEAAAALSIYADCPYPEARSREQRLRARAAGDSPRGRRCAPSAIPAFDLALDEAGGGRGVEHRVRDALAAVEEEETWVHYVENGLINSLFGLLCWPAIFAPVRGAFFHAFHHGPADLSCAGFVARRRREFAGCLGELANGGYREAILARYEEKQGILSPFVAWGLIDEVLLRRALECFPAAHLHAWFEWILRDVRVNRSGFPDLVQFWPSSGRYRLIEVKGPGDRLQDNQRRCLHHCLDHGIPVSVCRVRRAGVAPQIA